MAAQTVFERIKAVRTALKISQREFARHVFVSQSYFSEVETGERNVGRRIVHLIATEYNVNEDWLLTGKGEMFATSETDIRLRQLITVFYELDEMLQEYLLQQGKELLKIQKEKMDK
jgi:transcriptional regulator with XRE-family HTH domain